MIFFLLFGLNYNSNALKFMQAPTVYMCNKLVDILNTLKYNYSKHCLCSLRARNGAREITPPTGNAEVIVVVMPMAIVKMSKWPVEQ